MEVGSSNLERWFWYFVISTLIVLCMGVVCHIVVELDTEYHHYFMDAYNRSAKLLLSHTPRVRGGMTSLGSVPQLVDAVSHSQAMHIALDFMGCQPIRSPSALHLARTLARDSMCERGDWPYIRPPVWELVQTVSRPPRDLELVTAMPQPVLASGRGLALITTQTRGEDPMPQLGVKPQACLHVVFADTDAVYELKADGTGPDLVHPDEAVYGTKGRVHEHFYRAVHGDVEVIRAAALSMQKQFPGHRHAVHLYGRFTGAAKAAIATLGVTTLPNLSVLTYTEGCIVVMDTIASADLQRRIAPCPGDDKVVLPTLGANNDSTQKPFDRNNICLFNVMHVHDMLPSCVYGHMSHHAPLIVVGETRDRANARLVHRFVEWNMVQDAVLKMFYVWARKRRGELYTRAMEDQVRGMTKEERWSGGEILWSATTYGFLYHLVAWPKTAPSPVLTPVPNTGHSIHPAVAHFATHGGLVCTEDAGSGTSEDAPLAKED